METMEDLDLLYTPVEGDVDTDFEEDDETEAAEVNDLQADAPAQAMIIVKGKSRLPLPKGWRQERGDDRRLYTFNEKGQSRCGAWLPKRQKYCDASPKTGKNRCNIHGGKSLGGIDSPRYKTGEQSIYRNDIPVRLRARLDEAMSDNELITMRNEIGILKVRLADLLSRTDSGESGELWKKLKKTYGELTKALRNEDEEESNVLMAEIGQLIMRGYQDYTAWNEAERTMERIRKAKESERKLMTDMNQVVYVEQLMGVISVLTDSIQRNVPDRDARIRITQDIRQIMAVQEQKKGIKS